MNQLLSISKTLPSELKKNKCIPKEYEDDILSALSRFPELIDVKINFRLTSRASVPYHTKPTLASCFMAKSKRVFTISILEQAEGEGARVLFRNLTPAVRAAVIAHQLGHVMQYNDCQALSILHNTLLYLTSSYKRIIERRSDLCAISHGFGHELLELAQYIRSIPKSVKARQEIIKNYLKPTEICYFLRHPEQLRYAF